MAGRPALPGLRPAGPARDAALLLAALLCYWVDHPERRWLTWLLVAVFVVVMIFPFLGLWATGQGLAP